MLFVNNTEDYNMKLFVCLACMIALLGVTMQGTALAVGYERIEIKRYADGRIITNEPPQKHVVSAVQEATFVERVPELLDTVKFTVRDILAQFGIADHDDR